MNKRLHCQRNGAQFDRLLFQFGEPAGLRIMLLASNARRVVLIYDHSLLKAAVSEEALTSSYLRPLLWQSLC
eukprot:scaffold322826_cov25-Prasinocladus_malaysianus.AAC.3